MVSKQTEGRTELEVREDTTGRLHELLLMNIPPEREGGEEAPSVARRKARGTIIATIDLEQVAASIVVVDTPKEASCSPAITLIDGHLVA